MLRKEYWSRSKELIGWANEEELNVLAQQARKELNKRMTAYTDKFDVKESERAARGRKKAKAGAINKSKQTNKQVMT